MRLSFKHYGPQRLNAVTFRGVVAMISTRPICRTGPVVLPARWGRRGVLPRHGQLPVILPMCFCLYQHNPHDGE